MATNLNKTNNDYYSVQQDDSLLVKWFVSKNHLEQGLQGTCKSVTEKNMHDFEINTGNCLTEMAEDNLCPARLSFPKQLWKFAVLSGMSKVLDIGGIWAVFPSPQIFFDPNGNCSGLTTWTWMMFAANIEPWRRQRKAESLSQVKDNQNSTALKEWHGFNPAEHLKIKALLGSACFGGN